MVKLHFDIRDIFRLIRLGWSGKKIWVGLCGLVTMWAGYSILVVLAHVASGSSLSQVWQQYNLFPGADPAHHPIAGKILDLLAMIYAFVVFFFSLTMICKITFQQLRGDDFYSSGDAWKFLKDNWSGAIFGPLAALALFLFFVIVGILIGGVGGLIPYVGELLFAVSFIPIFFAALVAVFIAIAVVVALLLSPAVVGTVGEDSLEVVIQSFSLAWSEPWRLILYSVWATISVWIGAVLLGSFMAATVRLLNWASAIFMRDKLANMMEVATLYLPFENYRLRGGGRVAVEVDFMSGLGAAGTVSGSEAWAGYILAVMLIVLTGIWVAYGMAAYGSGISLIYVILRKRKDDENLLEWEDEAIEEPRLTEPESTDSSDADSGGSGGEESEGSSEVSGGAEEDGS